MIGRIEMGVYMAGEASRVSQTKKRIPQEFQVRLGYIGSHRLVESTLRLTEGTDRNPPLKGETRSCCARVPKSILFVEWPGIQTLRRGNQVNIARLKIFSTGEQFMSCRIGGILLVGNNIPFEDVFSMKSQTTA